MYWYFKALRNFTKFNGRASRKEFWIFKLFDIFFAFIALILDFTLPNFLADNSSNQNRRTKPKYESFKD